MSGKIPAQATAKSVMASAKRLMEVRHFWFSKNRIAEIRVPAWPIPIHQTKLTIAKPQPTGVLMPQIPTPLMISQARATVSIITMLNEMANPATQPRDVGRVRTIELILSVTEVKVCPGPSTGERRRISGESIEGGCPALIPSPFPDWDCVQRPDRSCAAEC